DAAPCLALLDILLLFYTDTPPTEISTLSLHDALPIFQALHAALMGPEAVPAVDQDHLPGHGLQHEGPVDGRIAPADDQNPSPLVALEGIHLVGQSPPFQRLSAGHPELPRGHGPDACGHQHRPGE